MWSKFDNVTPTLAKRFNKGKDGDFAVQQKKKHDFFKRQFRRLDKK